MRIIGIISIQQLLSFPKAIIIQKQYSAYFIYVIVGKRYLTKLQVKSPYYYIGVNSSKDM